MSRNLRLRALLDSWFELVVVALVVVALIGAWGTYATHIDPETTTEERVESSWAIDGAFEHEATVTEPNPIYPQGTRLDDRSIYPANIAPELNGTFVFRYEASDGGDVDVEIDLSLQRRAIAEADDNGEIVWENSEEIDSRAESPFYPHTELTEGFSLGFSAVRNETERIEEEIGQVPGDIETSVRADVHVSGIVNGESVDERRTYEMFIRADSDTYRISTDAATRDEFESTRNVPVERSYSPIRTVGAPLSLLVSIGLLSGLFVAKRRGLALDEHERALLAYRDDREDLGEWVSAMSLPDRVDDSPRVEAASLADLVDFAIDTDSGVIYDPDRGTYVVLHRDVAYVYHPPEEGDLEEAAPEEDIPDETD